MSNQSSRQASVRAISGTQFTYEGDWHAMWNLQAIPQGTFNERMLAYINTKLGTAYTELNGAMAALAKSFGIQTFNELATFDASTAPIPAFSTNFATQPQGTTPTGYSFSRSSSATYYDSAGVQQVAATDVPRYDYDPQTLTFRGLLIESTRTNYLINSTAPATQTVTLGPATYIMWTRGSGTATVSAGTAVGTGFGVTVSGSAGSYGTPVTFVVTTGGTVNVTVTGSLTQFQMENGSFPSSFIITTGSAATRSADNMQITDVSWFNISEGTFVAKAMTSSIGASSQIFNVSNASAETDYISLNISSTGQVIGSSRVASGIVTSTPVLGTATAMSMANTALAYGSAQLFGSMNGGAVVSASANLPTTITIGALGRRIISVSQLLNGWVTYFAYYKTRLSDSELVSLTTIPVSLKLLQGTDRATVMGFTNQFKTSRPSVYTLAQCRADFRTGRYALTNPRFIVANWGLDPTLLGEAGPGNSVVAKVAYETTSPVATTPVLFSGTQNVTIGDKLQAVSDALPITIPPSTAFEIRMGIEVPDATTANYFDGLANDGSNFRAGTMGSAGEQINGTGSLTGGAGVISYGMSPIAIVGELPVGAKSVAFYGDSITAGVGDGTAYNHFNAAPSATLWTSTGAGVSFSGGAVFTAAATGDKIGIVNSTYFRSTANYTVSITIASYTTGAIRLFLDGVDIGAFTAANGVQTLSLPSAGMTAASSLELRASGVTTLNITNVQIRALYPVTYKEIGMYTRAMVRSDGAGTIPHTNYGRSGAFLQNLASPTGGALQKAMGQYYTHAVVALGTNDFGGVPAFSTMQAAYLNVWRALKAQGCHVTAVTIMPRTMSWTDQTVFSASYNPGAVKDQINDWIRTQVGIEIDYLIDLAAVFEDPMDKSKWNTSGQILSEGTHPSAMGVRFAQDALDAYVNEVL